MSSTPSKRPASPLSSIPPAKRHRPTPPASPLSPLQSLLQFWLSPCNLSKDQFLTSAMLENDGWVPVSLFTTFNKAIALNATSSDVLIALRSLPSPSLEYRDISSQPEIRLEGGATKLKQIVTEARQGEDSRTLYLEPLAPNTTREQVDTLFSRFGNVSYVSIPRFPNGRCKGFCFVEFLEVEAARHALRHVNEGKVDIGGDTEVRGLWRVDWRRRKEIFKEELRKKKLEAARRRHGFQVGGERGAEEEEEEGRRKGKGGRQRRMKRRGVKGREKEGVQGAKVVDVDTNKTPRAAVVSDEAEESTKAEAQGKTTAPMSAEAEEKRGRTKSGGRLPDPEERSDEGAVAGGGERSAQGGKEIENAGEEQEGGRQETADGVEGKEREANGVKRKMEKVEFEFGLILEVGGLRKGMSRKDVYQWMQGFGRVAFVDVAWGRADVCRVRFDNAEGVSNALKGVMGKAGGRPGLNEEDKMVGRVLAGKEEEEYWRYVRERQRKVKERWERKRSRIDGQGIRAETV